LRDTLLRALAATAPGRYTLVSPPEKRSGRIFVDYLRNGRDTMAIGTWSPRAAHKRRSVGGEGPARAAARAVAS
jgi:DNA primase